MYLNSLAKAVHDTAVAKGWYEEPRGFPELVSLMHSELSEALEAYRDGKDGLVIIPGKHGDKPEGVGIELADCIIRILDACAYLGIDIEECILLKTEYNKTRPHRHGGKRA